MTQNGRILAATFEKDIKYYILYSLGYNRVGAFILINNILVLNSLPPFRSHAYVNSKILEVNAVLLSFTNSLWFYLSKD